MSLCSILFKNAIAAGLHMSSLPTHNTPATRNPAHRRVTVFKTPAVYAPLCPASLYCPNDSLVGAGLVAASSASSSSSSLRISSMRPSLPQ